MQVFCDSSAWVPLILRESASADLWEAKAGADGIWAWNWMKVETEAALACRGAKSDAWKNWHQLGAEVSWIDLHPDQTEMLYVYGSGVLLSERIFQDEEAADKEADSGDPAHERSQACESCG